MPPVTRSSASREKWAEQVARVVRRLDSHAGAIELTEVGVAIAGLDLRLPEEIAATAMQEDVDVIGVSLMSGGQVEVTTQMVRALNAAGHEQVPVVFGGTIRPSIFPSSNRWASGRSFAGAKRLRRWSRRSLRSPPSRGRRAVARLGHRHPAVDDDGLTGHVVGRA